MKNFPEMGGGKSPKFPLKAAIRKALGQSNRALTRMELAQLLERYRSSICSPVFELVKAGQIVKVERRICTVTGHKAQSLTLAGKEAKSGK